MCRRCPAVPSAYTDDSAGVPVIRHFSTVWLRACMMAAYVLSKAYAKLIFCVVDDIRSCQCSQDRITGVLGFRVS